MRHKGSANLFAVTLFASWERCAFGASNPKGLLCRCLSPAGSPCHFCRGLLLDLAVACGHFLSSALEAPRWLQGPPETLQGTPRSLHRSSSHEHVQHTCTVGVVTTVTRLMAPGWPRSACHNCHQYPPIGTNTSFTSCTPCKPYHCHQLMCRTSHCLPCWLPILRLEPTSARRVELSKGRNWYLKPS